VSGISLFARARRWRTNLGVAAGVGVLIVLAGPVYYSLNPDRGPLVAIIAQLPLVSAVTLQATSVSPMAAQERLAGRSMRGHRVLHHIAVTVLVALILGIAASLSGADSRPGGEPVGAVTVVRDLLAFTGAAMVGGAVLGAPLGWVLPSAWAILPLLLHTSTTAEDGLASLVVQPEDSFPALATAVVVWSAGLVVAGGGATGEVTVRSAAHRLSVAVTRARLRSGGRGRVRARRAEATDAHHRR
jgi:hypothetical protein